MAQLTLNLLGEFAVWHQNEPVQSFYSDKVRALLVYLVIERSQLHSRTKLAGMLWPDFPEKQARQSLRQAIFHLRKALKEKKDEAPFILADRQTVQLNSTLDVDCDVTRFETALDKVGGAAEAVDAYKGDFLAGFFLADSTEFEDWVLVQRETLRSDALAAYHLLVAELEQKGEYQSVIRTGLRWLALEPWQEDAHRAIMRSHFALGDQIAALAQYESCVKVLKESLAIEPTAETRSLFNEIRISSRTGRSNLPTPTSPFIGREKEIEAILSRLEDPACRLFTITGVGGSGKTRLAIESASRLETTREILFISLDALDDASAVPLALADLFGMVLSNADSPQAQLSAFLADKEMLLILDNIEQLLAGEQGQQLRQFLGELLSDLPDLKLVATSRIRLGLSIEHVYTVAGLPEPQGHDSLESNEAVALFVQSGNRVRHDFRLTSENEAAIREICQLCAGLPLALELAASWVHILEPADIAQELTENLDLLTSSSPDVPARQQSLPAVFAQAWERLNPQEQKVLRQLSIFRGGFSREAAQKVAGTPFPLLASLIDKALMQRLMSTGTPRFALHKPLRLYAREKLEAAGEEADVADRHQAYYIDFLLKRRAPMEGAGLGKALQEIGTEIDNVRAAWQQALAKRDQQALDDGVATLYYYYQTQSWLQEGSTVLGQASELLAPERHERETGRIWARITARQAWLNFLLGDQDVARQRMEACLAILHAQGHEPHMLFPLCFLAAACNRTGELRTAVSAIKQALTLAERLNDDYYGAIANNIAGRIYKQQNKLDQAQKHYERSLALANRTGNEATTAYALSFLGELAFERGEFEAAEHLHQQSLTTRQGLADRRGVARSHLLLGDTVRAAGNLDAAFRAYDEAVQTFKSIGDQLGISSAHIRLAQIALAKGQDVSRDMQTALRIAMRGRMTPQIGRIINWLQQNTRATFPGWDEQQTSGRYSQIEPFAQQALVWLTGQQQ